MNSKKQDIHSLAKHEYKSIHNLRDMEFMLHEKLLTETLEFKLLKLKYKIKLAWSDFWNRRRVK